MQGSDMFKMGPSWGIGSDDRPKKTRLVTNFLVRAKDYNGYKNVLFMMKTNDFRLTDPMFADDYVVLCRGIYNRKKAMLTTETGVVYRVFPDWSVKEVKK